MVRVAQGQALTAPGGSVGLSRLGLVIVLHSRSLSGSTGALMVTTDSLMVVIDSAFV